MAKIDLKKREPLLVNKTPVGTNNMTSRASFYQKKLYEKVAFNRPSLSDTDPIDMWYEKLFYGRLTDKSKVVHLSEAKLKQLPGTELFAVDFVRDAFVELQSYFRFLRQRGVLCDDGVFADLRARKAWESVNQIYHESMVNLYEKFKVYMLNKEVKLTGFNSFMNLFTNFIDTVCPNYPITRSQLVLSRVNNPRSSGLIIEVDDEDHGNDKRKYENYLNDPNYPIFKTSATRFGFTVDKHAPWRLVADLDNPAMLEFMQARGVTMESFFEDYYYDTELLDLEALKVYMIQFYNSYVAAKPSFVIPKMTYCKGRVSVSNMKVVRELIKEKELETQLNDDFWIRVYTYVRGREENQKWSQSDFDKIVKTSYHLKKGLDMSHVIRYINREARFTSKSTRKNRNYRWLS